MIQVLFNAGYSNSPELTLTDGSYAPSTAKLVQTESIFPGNWKKAPISCIRRVLTIHANSKTGLGT